MAIAASTAVNTYDATCDLAPNAAGTLVERKPASPGAPLKIWLIDDDDEFRGLLAELLNNQQGIACKGGFGSSESALKALTPETVPDVVLLDLNLGDASGLEAIQPLKSRAPATHILMLTTFYDSISESKAFEAGASGFLLKSYEPEQIVQAIRQTHANISEREGQRSTLWPKRISERPLPIQSNPPRQATHSQRLSFLRGLFNLLAL